MKTLFISLLMTMFFSINASAQLYNYYQSITVEHLSFSTGTQGCVSVALVAHYSLNGNQYSVVGNYVVVDPNNSFSIVVFIPQGANVTSKELRFSTSSGDYFNHTPGSYNQIFSNGAGNQLCDPSPGGTKQLFIESTTRNLVKFHINQISGRSW